MKEFYQFPKDGYTEYEETKEIYLCVAQISFNICMTTGKGINPSEFKQEVKTAEISPYKLNQRMEREEDFVLSFTYSIVV